MSEPHTSDPIAPEIRERKGELSLHFGQPTIQSRMLLAEPERLVLDYTRTMMGFLLFRPEPDDIVMIGLGGGSLAKYCHNALPSCRFTALELSPAVIALRDRFCIPADSARFSVICCDGAAYVSELNACVDILLVDGFDANGQPPALCSPAFYSNCRRALRANGILVVNLCADDSGYGRYVRRILEAFDGRVITIEADERDNKIVFASAGPGFPPSFAELDARVRLLERRHPVDLERTAQKILASSRVTAETPAPRKGRRR